MVRPDKIELVNGVSEQLKHSQSIVLTDFQRMTVAELSALRVKLREQSVEMRVIKNRLIRRALSEAGCEALDDYLHGNTAVVFGLNDPVAPAKVLTEFAKGNNKLVIKGGLLERKRLDAKGVENLSKMPGRRELLSIMAGDLKQPATKMAAVFQAALLKVAYAMQSLAKKQEDAGAAA